MYLRTEKPLKSYFFVSLDTCFHQFSWVLDHRFCCQRALGNKPKALLFGLIFLIFASKSCKTFEKCRKRWFQPPFGVCSTQTLVQIYNVFPAWIYIINLFVLFIFSFFHKRIISIDSMTWRAISLLFVREFSLRKFIAFWVLYCSLRPHAD